LYVVVFADGNSWVSLLFPIILRREGHVGGGVNLQSHPSVAKKSCTVAMCDED